ncbi:hypothetical protein N9N67_04510 [Bacteriovoracaceae bacterium]|nr:hypothetical protein [Bacteriovoracaceae bacterium]
MRIFNEQNTILTPYGGVVSDNKDDDLTRIEDMASFEHEEEADIPPFQNLDEGDEEFNSNELPPNLEDDQTFPNSTFSQDDESFNDGPPDEESFGSEEFTTGDDAVFDQPDDSIFEEPTDPNIEFPSDANFGQIEDDEPLTDFSADSDQEFSSNDSVSVNEELNQEELNPVEEDIEEPGMFQEMTRESIDSLTLSNDIEDNTKLKNKEEIKVKEIEDSPQPQAPKVEKKPEPIKLDPIKASEISEPAKKLVIHSNILDEKKQKQATPQPTEKSFESTKKMANSDSFAYAQIAAEGNPAFSVILKDIKFQEDADDILRLLKEFKVIKSADEEKTRTALNRGSFLIPRVGEYVAIYLCQKLRKYNINILMGLSDEIHASDLYDRHEEIGLMSKENVFQNRQDYIDFVQRPYGVPENIIVSTSNYLESYKVLEHLGVITEYTIIDTKSSPHYLSMEDDLIEHAPFIHQDKLKQQQMIRLNQESSQSTHGGLEQIFSSSSQARHQQSPSINDVYKDLTEKLKQNAISSGANGIIGISFHITPIFAHETQAFDNKYRITATGNLVWLKKK